MFFARRSLLVFTGIAAGLFLLTQCVEKPGSDKPVIKNAFGEQFAGSESCISCHKETVERHRKTSHYFTSQPATDETVHGSFHEDSNRYVFNPTQYVAMEKRDSGYYEVLYTKGIEVRREKVEMVIGSGTKGQMLVYRNGPKWFQLPVFYYAAKNEWANSPGFPGQVIFSRAITSRCMECHSTYAQKISDAFKEPEEFDYNRVIYGVDCERCHGAAQQHVDFHTEHPEDTVAKHIINPANLSRMQNLNLCALCHGGRMMKTLPSFSFRVGDTLTNFFHKDTAAKDASSIDVHGNQYGLLAASKCFQNTAMTCTTCHDSHANERGQMQAFSAKCASCHNEQHGPTCGMAATMGQVIQQNCIDCHMPVQPSKAIVFLEQGSDKPVKASMRSHFINIYPEETKKYKALLSQKN